MKKSKGNHILGWFQNNPNTSTERTSVKRVLKKFKFKPHRTRRKLHLVPADYDKSPKLWE